MGGPNTVTWAKVVGDLNYLGGQKWQETAPIGAGAAFHVFSSLKFNELIRDSGNNILQIITEIGSSIRIDVVKLARYLPTHLIAKVMLSEKDEASLKYLLCGIRLLHSLCDLAPKHSKLEQILLDDVKVSEQLLDLVFYLLIVLSNYRQEHHVSNPMPLLHSALVACSLYLLTGGIASQWQEIASVLVAHRKVDIFINAAFTALRIDIKFLQLKLSGQCTDLPTKSSSNAEGTLNYLCQQCEASLQFLQSLCQQKSFRERIVKNKELCGEGGILLLAQAILTLNTTPLFRESSSVVAAVSRLKSKILSILLHLCEAESISYLDEVASSPRSMPLAKSVLLEVLDLLKTMVVRDPNILSTCSDKNYPTGLLQLNAMRLADIFSDDSNFRSYITTYFSIEAKRGQNPITDWIEMIEVLSNKYLPHSYQGDRLEAMERKRKLEERRNQFIEVLEQIKIISNELYNDSDDTPSSIVVDEIDLSFRKLEELHSEFRDLQQDKGDRQKYVLDLLNTVNSLCKILGIDFKQTTGVLTATFSLPHQEFLSSWCSSDLPIWEEDATMEYDSFAAAGCVMDSFFSSDLLNIANSGSTFIPSNMQRASYAHQRTSLLVKVIANLHCYVPGICKGSAFSFSDVFSDVEEEEVFLNKFLECLQRELPKLSTFDAEKAVIVGRNLRSLLSHAESLTPQYLNEEDVHLLRVFVMRLESLITPVDLEVNRVQEAQSAGGCSSPVLEKVGPGRTNRSCYLKEGTSENSAFQEEGQFYVRSNCIDQTGDIVWQDKGEDKGGSGIASHYDSAESPAEDVYIPSAPRGTHQSVIEESTSGTGTKEKVEAVLAESNDIASAGFVQCEPGWYVVLVDQQGEEIGKGKVYQAQGNWFGRNLEGSEMCVVDVIELKAERRTRLPHPCEVTGTSFEEAENKLGLMRVLWDSNKLFMLPPR
ncbi:sequence-specific DNA binding transcription factor ATNDX [Actinidia rufa]|uniref:Sequence-specific DNA binding transcription factor ATNDX n=1 Tax=Actinidia rufa TaxID=165716 RepID=A0A7J0G1K1_9ERIC|nr:sequence-specific DNA binding transcription factor ATNDX [Actinidia rufa]